MAPAKLKKIIEQENIKQLLSDLDIAKKLNVSRAYVTILRKNLHIPDSRDRLRNHLRPLVANFMARGGSAKSITEILQKEGYDVTRFIINTLFSEIKINENNDLQKSNQSLQNRNNCAILDAARQQNDAVEDPFCSIIGYAGNLSPQIQLAKASMMYPPRGLHTLIVGPSGVGKTLLVGAMHRFLQLIKGDTIPLVTFNCADYSENPQLLLSQLFGHVKGAFTNADNKKEGLIDRADNGLLFLDEIHRLPAEGQEVLFQILDHGEFRRLGETSACNKVYVTIIAATTEDPESSLLITFRRRLPVLIRMPALIDRSMEERAEIIRHFFLNEALRTHKNFYISKDVIKSLLIYDCPGNAGQLRSDIQVISAKCFLTYSAQNKSKFQVTVENLPEHIDIKTDVLNEERMNNLVPGDWIINCGYQDEIIESDDICAIPEYNQKNIITDHSITYSGLGVSWGVALGNIIRIIDKTSIDNKIIPSNEIKPQTDLLDESIKKYRQELQQILREGKTFVSEKELEIIRANFLVLEDAKFLKEIHSMITMECRTASYAVDSVLKKHINIFENMRNDYFKKRSSCFAEIYRRLLSHINGAGKISILPEGSVIVAYDLGVSEVFFFDPARVAAIVTEKGGRSSHISILSRALGIPSVVGVKGIMEDVSDNQQIIVDADNGNIIVNPDANTCKYYAFRIEQNKKELEELQQALNQPAVTIDGHEISLFATIGNLKEVDIALKNGAQGIGLFRTEFLCVSDEKFPSEAEQEAIYRNVLLKMQNKPVVVRTIDVGFDKNLPYFPVVLEKNPALGRRGIRLCLKEQKPFITQLRALLKASLWGNLSILFPMISTVDEIRETKNLVLRVKNELKEEGIRVAENIRIGALIEVPAAAINADLIADEVDFFSIGTNDLTQYVFAADRENCDLDYLYKPLDSAIIRLISHVVSIGKQKNIPICLCGEVAGNQNATELLLKLGIVSLSMASSSIPIIKRKLRRLSVYSSPETHTAGLDKIIHGTNAIGFTLLPEKYP